MTKVDMMEIQNPTNPRILPKKRLKINYKKINYKSYDVVVTALTMISLRFPNDYTEAMFDAEVKGTKFACDARHPVETIDGEPIDGQTTDGNHRICHVFSEYRKKSDEEMQEHEERFNMLRDEIQTKFGHVITYHKSGGINSGQCRFTCGFCGTKDQTSSIRGLRGSKASDRCKKCRMWQKYDDLCADFEATKNFTMAMTRNEFYDEYKKTAYNINVTVRCKCEYKGVFTSRMTHLKNGLTKGCNACKNNRRETTSIVRYGVPYPMQNLDVMDKNFKSAHSYKSYVLPSGRLVHLQGYEYDALLHLLYGSYVCGWNPLFVFTEQNLLITKREVGRFIYHTSNGNPHYYFPDFKIVGTDIFIEVKSTHTIFLDLDIVLAKLKAVCDDGCQIVVMVLDIAKDIHFAELDHTNIDAYMSTMRRMSELRAQKMNMDMMRTIDNFRTWYDNL